MAVFKCKMCGGMLEIDNGQSVATCEYCGTQQTLPALNDTKLVNMFERADQFRRRKDFDKAMAIYEEILTEQNDDAEIYWSIVLCRYGIEYVDDPYSGNKIPTVNRAQYTSIYDDLDYQSAIKYANMMQKNIYEHEAEAINNIQKEILEISNQEEPYDVFICYKETDENGERTHDSVHATELYYELTDLGYKVFFARITLEDKLGSAYEPYIFAALNSSKVMVVLGTRPEYFNAVWVKNEWSRYLALMKNDRKRILIPAYKNMDPYNLPKEFSHLQALDMNKLGFMSDLTRGIKKIIGEKAQPIPQNEPLDVEPKYTHTKEKTSKPEEWYIGAVKVSHKDIKTVDTYMSDNRKLDAIRYICKTTGLGLAEAKTWVENYHFYDLNHEHEIINQQTSTNSSIEDLIKKGVDNLVKYTQNGLQNKPTETNDDDDDSDETLDLATLQKNTTPILF